MACIHNKYRKIRSNNDKFRKEIKDGEWERVLLKIGNKQKMEELCVLLKHFEGCFVKVDGIICKLKKVEIPPAWSCILFDDGGLQWFALGSYFDIYLPLKR